MGAPRAGSAAASATAAWARVTSALASEPPPKSIPPLAPRACSRYWIPPRVAWQTASPVGSGSTAPSAL